MMSTANRRAALLLARRARASAPISSIRALSISSRASSNASVPNVSKTNELPQGKQQEDDVLVHENVENAQKFRAMQEPNRATTWSRSQKTRELAMSGPRFEQTIVELQPAPAAAIELIHQQPVRWIHERTVECDGGGGPLGHPRVFINLDKPEICTCTYCGLPFANEHHRTYLESLPSTPYPLTPQGNAAEVNLNQRVTDGAFEQR
ncbi:hypothetical protein V496_02847 [Pseudogymnoascus sp. VKM F-4515 (FW-2607)]|nr:hypothetical protein V496_02847 [Pseudogymnoascus sp. VKM F-4515 (FW-2607)]